MKRNETDYPTLKKDVTPALLIRLQGKWIEKVEEIEPGYFRTGYGWVESMSSLLKYDATRAWWGLNLETIKERNIVYAVACRATLTRAVYRIDEWIGPRSEDGDWAFLGEEIKTGKICDEYIGLKGRWVPTKKGERKETTLWPPTN